MSSLIFSHWILLLTSLTSSILIASLWYSYVPDITSSTSSKRHFAKKDKGLLYLSFAIGIWGISSLLHLIIPNYTNMPINSIISAVNSTSLLIACTYLENTPSLIKTNRKQYIYGIIVSGSLDILLTIIIWNWNPDSVLLQIPDFILSTLTVLLLIISLYRAFKTRGLPLLSLFSIVALLMLLLAQPLVHFSIIPIKTDYGVMLGLYSRISFIIIICFLAYSWVQRNLNAAQIKISEMSILLETLNAEIDEAKKIISSDKETAQRIQRELAWKDIAMKAAHKIGNPIDSIDTYADRISRNLSGKDYSKARQNLDSMDESIEDAKVVLSEFKSLTTLMEIKPHNVDILKMIRKLCDDLNRDEEIEAGIHNYVEIPTASFTRTSSLTIELNNIRNRDDLFVYIDRKKIKQCLDELVANSIHFFDKNQKLILFSIDLVKALPERFEKKHERYLLINYIDNGPGIESDNKRNIYTPFYTTFNKGTGLGLAIVERIIQLHEGHIEEVGILGQGVCFNIYLPYITKNETENTIS